MCPRFTEERRQKQRVPLTRALIARFGTMGAIMLDITDAGARIEHFARLDIGRRNRFRFDWQDRPIEMDARVVACRIHRFAHGDDGTTVYESGLQFLAFHGNSAATLREFVTTLVSRSLAEQVANARGIGPVTQNTMPVFRSGGVVATAIDASSERNRHLLPAHELVTHRGYLCCTLGANGRWDRKWSRFADQPENGFTVHASEPRDHVDQLCDEYTQADWERRKLIRLMAKASVESAQDTLEPV